jgi:alpha-ketoglutarate-dependent taurine dioxygenase
MSIATKKLSETVGVEVLDVERDRLLHDPLLPNAALGALETYGVLVFREVGLDDETLVTFGRRLGDLVARPGNPIPEVTAITQRPDNRLAEYFRGNVQWHIDGAQDDVPCRAGVLTARVIEPGDSGTEFASTYAAYDDLTDEERERFDDLQVIHRLEATMRGVYPDPSPEQVAAWQLQGTAKEHPLVWTHRSGRKSLVLGVHADEIVGMDLDEGRAILSDLLGRATRPERVLRHDWAVGDVVVWDNTGVLHRVTDLNPASHRDLRRVTVAGDEPIQ